ncbi:T9SS type A sorting domain-containing protein [Aequorivita marina]|uniref:T9SS type A sorting domain-containing protein n=1 Tax=Aequorivita marina TaxID=3073654 RepID=UPI002874D2BD|nr:T9SS type A sorting domain-containing protein [Aequorivita sp. S2608]MDS1299475.1 T9SS type A sorting domain-containing protein [Aequorivita sp. S2608]
MKKIYLLFLIFLLSYFSIQAQTIDVVTGISTPSRLLINGNDLYFSTTSEVFKIDITQTSPTPTSVVSGLNAATGMAMAGNTLYIAEFNAGRISKIDISDPTPSLETVISGLNTPNGLYLSGNTMYYSDNNSNIVEKFDVTDLNPTTTLVATSAVNFSPSGLALHESILYMAQSQSNRVSKVDVDSGVTQPTDVVVGVNRPLGIRLNGNNLIIAEYIGNKISMKDLTNSANTAIDLVTGVNQPTDIEISGSTLFILEKGANKISKVENILGLDTRYQRNHFKLYPNPAHNFIQIANLQTPTFYEIYTIVGAKVTTGTIDPNERVNIERLAAGVYILKMKNGHVVKFVKE